MAEMVEVAVSLLTSNAVAVSLSGLSGPAWSQRLLWLPKADQSPKWFVGSLQVAVTFSGSIQ